MQITSTMMLNLLIASGYSDAEAANVITSGDPDKNVQLMEQYGIDQVYKWQAAYGDAMSMLLGMYNSPAPSFFSQKNILIIGGVAILILLLGRKK